MSWQKCAISNLQSLYADFVPLQKRNKKKKTEKKTESYASDAGADIVARVKHELREIMLLVRHREWYAIAMGKYS